MTSLNFKGKSAVWNHHLSVPFHTLDEDKKLSLKGENADENLIIEGDNLLALKALLPKYQGKVKCVYIDPPYNTGNEGWVYNDKVNAPVIRDWYKQTVGKDDLAKHDKWLCMITPRIKLLYELLSSDGVMFISIDDNEFAYLRVLISCGGKVVMVEMEK
jgi:adenine-specific DNA-methyltransferase